MLLPSLETDTDAYPHSIHDYRDVTELGSQTISFALVCLQSLPGRIFFHNHHYCRMFEKRLQNQMEYSLVPHGESSKDIKAGLVSPQVRRTNSGEVQLELNHPL